MNKLPVIRESTIASFIYFIRGEKVMLDNDLAKLYRVETRVLSFSFYSRFAGFRRFASQLLSFLATLFLSPSVAPTPFRLIALPIRPLVLSIPAVKPSQNLIQ